MKNILSFLFLLLSFHALAQPLREADNDLNAALEAKSTAIDIAGVVTNTSCYDGADGAINITVSGGVAPYSYAWTFGTFTFATTEDVTGLIPLTYTITVTDATSATATTNFTVGQPAELVLSLNITQPSCWNSFATVVVTATGGTPPYTGTGTFSVFSDRSFDISDSKGCTASKTAFIFRPSEPEFFATAGTILCFNGTTTVTVGANGGTPPYTGTGTFINQGPGYHFYPVTDANGCTGSFAAQVTIPNPPEIIVSASAGTINCFGGTTTLTVTATGGTGTKQYSLNGITYQAGNTFTVNTAGSPYTVTVKDANACTKTTSAVTVTQPTQLTASLSSTAVSSPGATDGTATATPAGGTAPYTYSWNSSPIQTTATATGLAAGSYTVTVTDSKGCTTSNTVTIGAPACSLSASAAAGNIACFGGTTTLTVTAIGGTAPLQYSIDAGTTFQSGNTFTVLAGTYTVIVKDANACTVPTNSVTVTQPASALTASVTNATLNCAGTATVTVSASGGTTPYTNTGVQTVTSSGAINFTVTDANGCTFVVTSTVSPATGCPAISEVIYPKYVQGVGSGVPSADTKVPYACRMTLTGLTANTTYRYFPAFTTTPAIANDGAGAFIDVTQSGSFVRITSPSLASNYRTITSDATGKVTQWFIIEPTSAPEFTPGTQLYFRIMLNDASPFGTVPAYRITAANPVTVLGFGASSTEGTGLRSTAVSAYTAKNFVMLYDNEAGTGRPESGTFIESDGTANGSTENYAPFYAANVDGVDKTWGTIIPNNLSTGIRNVSQYRLSDGAYLNKCTSANGTFGSAVTANTTGGLTAQVMGCTPDAPALNITGVATNGACFDNFSGSINITVTGGTAPYTYSWLYEGPFGTIIFSSAEDVAGLSPANYTVTVTDAASAVVTQTFTITEPTQLVVTLDVTQPLCWNTLATVVVTATGGTAPYTGTGTFNIYSDQSFEVRDANGCTVSKTAFISRPGDIEAYATAGIIPCHDGTTTVVVGANGGTPPYTGTGTFTNQGPGYHYYPVTDANGCTGSFAAQVTIPNPPLLEASISAGTIACIGGTTTLTANFTGGQSFQKQYSLNGGPYQTSNTFTVDAAGSPYTVTVREVFTLCTATSNTITVTQSATALSATTSSTNATTPGGSEGTATAIPAGGTGPYTYSWNTSPVQTTITATGLSAGIYTVTVTDSRGCTTTASATVSSPSCAVTASASAGTITCFGGTTTLTVSSTNGIAPLQYSINNGPFQPSNSFTVGAGAYSVIVKDANGCTATTTGSITQPIAVAATYTNTPILCHGGTSSVTISGADGVAPYNGTGTFSQSAGTTVYNITDANGCPASVSVTITEPATLTAASTAPPIACNGGSTIITVSATGGTAPYTGTGTFTRSAGTYSFTVTDNNGCTSITDITITGPDLLVASSTAGIAVCGSNGNVIVTATGGTAPYTGTGTLSTPIGPYSYTVTDANGCTATTTGTVTCSGTSPLAVSIVKNDVSVCGGTNDGAIYATATGGIPPYTYSWTGLTGSNQTPFSAGNVSSITNLNYGFYNLTVTDDALNSVIINDIHVIKTFAVYITNSGTFTSSCALTGAIILYGNSGVRPYTYSLDGITYQSSNTFTGLGAGTYTGYVKDLAGCVSSKSITVGTLPAVAISSVYSRPASSCANDGSIEVYRSGGVPPYTYSIDGTTYQASNVFTALAPGSYTAWVKDSKGCTASQSTTVGVGAALSVTAGKTNSSSCVNDGSILATVTGGVAPYTYSIDGTTFQSGNSFNAVGPGSYTVTVKDSKGCTGTVGVVIAANPINVTFYSTNSATCVSNNGLIQLFRTGGFPPFTYSINNVTYQASNIFTGVAGGVYTGYVKDSRNCVGTANITITPLGCRPTLFVSNEKSSRSVSQAEIKIQAYPNPSAKDFTVVLEGFNTKESIVFTVTDLLGRVVYKQTGPAKLQYKFGSDFRTGIYTVQVIQADKQKTLKLVKE